MKTLTTSLVVLAVGVLAGHSLHAAVKDAAFLQGSTLADGSTVLDSATPKAIRWTERSSIDPNTFAHSFTDPAKLIVKKDGDYLVAATMPLISINTADNRPSQALEVYVNGEPAPGTVGSSGYIRNQPRNINMQQETSDHAHTLLAGLSAGDMIEVRAHKTAQAALATGIQSASLYVELVDNSRTVFAALSDGPISGANLNPNFNEDGDDPAELGWTSTRKDAGITHSDGSADIRLSAGAYILFVNIPMQATVQRASAGLEVLLDDEVVPGGLARQGYIRNASGHTRASVHWAGVIEVSGTKTLTLQTYRLARAGQVSLQSDKQASVYLEKIDAGSGLIASSAITVDNANNPDNWNPDAKAALVWEEPAAIDSALYRHNNSSIQVRRAGSYLLLYHDNLYSAAARPNPRISVEVNGAEVPGAETKSHYIRSEDGHNESSSTLVFLLEDLAANDTITISTQKEGQNGDVFSVDDIDPIDGGAIFSLIQKESIDPSSIESAPRLLSANGNINGFEASIQNFATTVDESSVQATLNGESVEADVSAGAGIVTIAYNFPEPPESLSIHQVSLRYTDSAAGIHQADFSFTVTAVFTRVPPAFATPGADTDAPGFVANVSQISIAQSGVAHVHGNRIAGAERQLAGGYTDADGNPYLNEAGPENASRWEISPANIETVINLEQGEDGIPGPTGIFTANNGNEDAAIPQIPGFEDNLDGIAVEFLAFLELNKGFHTLGVNSDDGFQVKIGPSVNDHGAIEIGLWNDSRPVSESTFTIYIEESGIYPVRLLWWEGGGGASVEFYSIMEDGEKILINDRSNARAIKAYRSGVNRPYISAVSPTGTSLTDTIEYTINDGDISLVEGSIALTLDGAALAPAIAKSGSVTTVRYTNPDGYFSSGNHRAVLTYNEASDPPITRTFAHEFTVPEGMEVILSDNPFAYWRFGETEGNSAYNAVSGIHTGTYNNNPGLGAERLVVGDPSPSVFLDAEQQHWIRLINHADINNLGGNPGWPQKTIEFWFKARNLPTSDLAHPDFEISQRQVIYEQGGATRGMNVYLVGTQPGPNPKEAELWFNVLNRAEVVWGGTLPYNDVDGVGTDQDAVAIKTTIQANAVYHVALVFQEDNEADSFEGGITGYLNGEKFGEAIGANQLRNHTDGIGIGRRNNEVSFHDLIINASTPAIFNSAEQFYYDGWLDEFALYNTALSAARVKVHYEAGLDEVPPIGGGMISIARDTGGIIAIHFTGTLKSADTITGDFTPVNGATSPYTVTADQEAKFYRVD